MSELQFVDPKTGKPIVVSYHKTGHLLVNQIGRKKCKQCSYDLVEIWNELLIFAALRAAIPDKFDDAVEHVPEYDVKNSCFNKYISAFINYYDDTNIYLKFMAKGYTC